MKKLKPKESKPIALVFTAISGVSLGLLLGIYVLINEPAARLAQEPDAARSAKPGDYTARYLPGRVGESETPNLRAALGRLQRRAPGEIALSEAELNYLLKEYAPAKAESSEDSGNSATMDQPNIRLVDDRMVLSARVVINTGGDRFEMLTQSEVGFVNSESGPRLVVQQMKFNSLPIPAVAGLARSLIQSQLDPEKLPEDWVKMWSNIREARVEEGQLIAKVGPRRT